MSSAIAERVEEVEHLADVAVVLHHAVRVHAEAGLALGLGPQVRPHVHARGVEPDEPGLVCPGLLLDEPLGLLRDLGVEGLHALLGERTRVLAALLAPRAEALVVGLRAHLVGGVAVEDAPGAELLLEPGDVIRIVGILRLLLGVEVVEVAEELVEAVDGRKELVAVTEVVLPELAGGVAPGLEQLGDRRVLGLEPLGGARQADLEHPRADGGLAGDEGGPPGGAALLGVGVGEERPFLRDAVDVGRAVAHHAAVVGAHVPVAHVVAEHHQDVGLLARLGLRRDGAQRHHDGGEKRRRQQLRLHSSSSLELAAGGAASVPPFSSILT